MRKLAAGVHPDRRWDDPDRHLHGDVHEVGWTRGTADIRQAPSRPANAPTVAVLACEKRHARELAPTLDNISTELLGSATTGRVEASNALERKQRKTGKPTIKLSVGKAPQIGDRPMHRPRGPPTDVTGGTLTDGRPIGPSIAANELVERRRARQARLAEGLRRSLPALAGKQQPVRNRPIICYWCKQAGHTSFSCPFARRPCPNCGSHGHRPADCRHAKRRTDDAPSEAAASAPAQRPTPACERAPPWNTISDSPGIRRAEDAPPQSPTEPAEEEPDWWGDDGELDPVEEPEARARRLQDGDQQEMRAAVQEISARPVRSALRARPAGPLNPGRRVTWGGAEESPTWARGELVTSSEELWWPPPNRSPTYRLIGGRLFM